MRNTAHAQCLHPGAGPCPRAVERRAPPRDGGTLSLRPTPVQRGRPSRRHATTVTPGAFAKASASVDVPRGERLGLEGGPSAVPEHGAGGRGPRPRSPRRVEGTMSIPSCRRATSDAVELSRCAPSRSDSPSTSRREVETARAGTRRGPALSAPVDVGFVNKGVDDGVAAWRPGTERHRPTTRIASATPRKRSRFNADLGRDLSRSQRDRRPKGRAGSSISPAPSRNLRSQEIAGPEAARVGDTTGWVRAGGLSRTSTLT